MADKIDKNKNTSKSKEEGSDFYKDIQTAMADGVYREKSNTQTNKVDDDEGIDTASKISEDSSLYKKKKKKKTKNKKNYEKTTFKHKMIVLATLLFLGVFTGSGLGVWYFNVTLKSNVDYSSMDVSMYKGDVNKVLEDDEKIGLSASDDKTQWVVKAKAMGKTPADFSAVDNFLLAEYNATLASSWTAIGTGKVATIATQTIYSAKKFDGNAYTFESISKGILSVATCDKMTKGQKSVEIYNGSNIGTDGADWTYNNTVTTDEFKEMCGNTPDAIQPYLISDTTVISSTEIVYDSENKTYSFTIELDPQTSVLLYYRQVKRSGDLEADPEFYSIKQTITIDENWNLVCIDSIESYKAVKFAMGNSCTGTLTTYYNFNVDVSLPV
jgi:hypothetical protein